MVATVGDASPEDGVGRKRIRLTKKTNVQKRFGFYLWKQPIPNRWKAAALRSAVIQGVEGQLSAAWWDFHMWMSHRELAE